METTVFFSTCSSAITNLENNLPVGITLRRLSNFGSETDSFDFSQIHYAAKIDLSKISIMEGVRYLLSKCSKFGHKHYFDLNGRRFLAQDTDAICTAAKKIAVKMMVPQ
jgi:hypothetical protein